MFLLGLPLMEASFLKPLPNGQLLWYCNALNGLTWGFGFEGYFGEENRLEKMKESFSELREEREIIVLGTHPCRLVTSEFWDTINFSKGENTPPENYKPAPLYPRSFIKELMRDIEAFIKWLRQQEVEFVTYRDILEQYKMPIDWVSLDVIFALAEGVIDRIDYRIVSNRSFSPAEIFSLFAWALTYYKTYKHLPNRIPPRQTIGPTFEIPPFEGEFEVKIGDFLEECSKLNQFITTWNKLPSSDKIGGREIGVGCILKAMAELLLRMKEGATIREVRIREAEIYPGIAEGLSLPHYENTWLKDISYQSRFAQFGEDLHHLKSHPCFFYPLFLEEKQSHIHHPLSLTGGHCLRRQSPFIHILPHLHLHEHEVLFVLGDYIYLSYFCAEI